jgi:Eco57I restriction-modification methylase
MLTPNEFAEQQKLMEMEAERSRSHFFMIMNGGAGTLWKKPEGGTKRIKKNKVAIYKLPKDKKIITEVIQSAYNGTPPAPPIVTMEYHPQVNTFTKYTEKEINSLIGPVIRAKFRHFSEHPLMTSETSGHLQNIHTPYTLIQDLFSKVELTVDDDVLIICNVEIVIYLVKVVGMDVSRIFFVDDGIDMRHVDGRIHSVKKQFLCDVVGMNPNNIMHVNNDGVIEMNKQQKVKQFRMVAGNPPYQSKKEGNSKSDNTLWQKIILNLKNTVSPNGILMMVHPSGWRNSKGTFTPIRDFYESWDLQYLNTNGFEDGKKVFNCSLRFDWVVVKNKPYSGTTEVNDDFGNTRFINVKEYPIIPNNVSIDFTKLFGDNKVDFQHSWSMYESRKDHMSPVKTDTHIYPCVMNVGVDNQPTKLWWSNEDKGHFGIPKVIFGVYGNGIFIDYAGEYGCTQHCAFIAAPVDELEKVREVMQSEEFLKAANATYVGGIATVYSRDFIKELKDGFWRE